METLESLKSFTVKEEDKKVLYEKYRRLYLARLIFLSFYPSSERVEVNTFYSSIADMSAIEDVFITEKIANLIESNLFPLYSEGLIKLANYLVHGNPSLERQVCSKLQLEHAIKVAHEILDS
jgi:hypothetical protein